MFEDLAAQMKVFIGLIGAFISAAIGSFARNVYVDGGFSIKRWLWDLSFAMLCALVVGGIGEMMHVAPVVIYGGSGAVGFLGPQWLESYLRRRAERKGSKDGDHQGA